MKQILCLMGALCSFGKVNKLNGKSDGFLHSAQPAAVPSVEMMIPRSKRNCRKSASKLFALSFALTSLFCVCLAHAGQRGLGNPAAAGVALPVDTIKAQRADVDADADLERFPLVKYEPDFSQVKPLVIGDSIPDYLWDLPLWVVNHPQGRDTVTLREYSGTKLLVLDFWARWCGPCITSMDKWEAFARQLPNELSLIGVHMDFDYKALPFSRKKGWKSTMVIGGNARIINKHFFRKGRVTRAVWIKDGRLVAITDNEGYDVNTVKNIAEQGGSVTSNLLGTYMEKPDEL